MTSNFSRIYGEETVVRVVDEQTYQAFLTPERWCCELYQGAVGDGPTVWVCEMAIRTQARCPRFVDACMPHDGWKPQFFLGRACAMGLTPRAAYKGAHADGQQRIKTFCRGEYSGFRLCRYCLFKYAGVVPEHPLRAPEERCRNVYAWPPLWEGDTMKAWTDYPFRELGDTPGYAGPWRWVKVLSYDGDKYCRVLVEGHTLEVKAGYLQTKRDTWLNYPIDVSQLPEVRR